MKIDKTNPKHWSYLFLTGLNTLLIIFMRPLILKKTKFAIVLYGHKLNGNLKALYVYLVKRTNIKPYYLTMDKQYYTELGKQGINALFTLKPLDMLRVGRASVMVTDHGLHTMLPLVWLTNINFIDVWHGIPYKGFSGADFRLQHRYDEIWVSSKDLKKMYVKKFGFNPQKVIPTGYARVDKLVAKKYSKGKILDKYNIDRGYKKYILFAPTWVQTEKNKSVIPFGVSESKFFEKLNLLAKRNAALIIFRVHLNTAENENYANYSNIKFMSYGDFPDAEEFLWISDILVTDWSSIAFDFLPLKRPTIFLDVPPMFSGGFSLGPEYRFGEIVKNFESLLQFTEKYIKDPRKYINKHKDKINHTIEVAYGNTLDGKAAARYYQRIKELIKL